MKNLNEHRFEDEWRKAFQEAELPPRADAWARIDAHLANQETQRYKRKLIWYQRIAAAVALFLLGTGGAWYWLGADKNYSGNGIVVTEHAQTPEVITHAGKAVPEKTRSGQPSVFSSGSEAAHPDRLLSKETQTADLSREQAQVAEQSAPVARRNNPFRDQSGGNQPVVRDNRSLDEQPVVRNNSTTGSSRNSVKNHRYTDPVHPEGQQLLSLNTEANHPAAQREKALPTRVENGRTEYSMLASRPVYIKSYIIRTPVHLPQLTGLYLAQIAAQHSEEGKEKEKEDGEFGRWQVGLAFAPSYFNPNMSLNEAATGYQTAANNLSSTAFLDTADPNRTSFSQANRELENADAAGVSYQSGLRLEYALSKRLSLQGGVDYLYNRSSITTRTYVNYLNNGVRVPVYNALLNYASKTGSESLVASDALGSNALSPAKSVSQSQDAVPVQNTYEYISIPMKVNYYWVGRKLGASIGTGISADVFIKNTIGNESEGIHTMKISSTRGTAYRNMGLSAWLGMKLHYKFAKRYSAFVEPGYRRAVTSFTNPESLQSHPYAFSIGTGLQVRL